MRSRAGSRWACGECRSSRPSRSRRATRCSSSASRTRSAASGPMPFARFMHRALYELGRRATTSPTAAGPGRTGDFLTAPESHPIFGWAIARQLEEVWERLGRPGALRRPGARRRHGRPRRRDPGRPAPIRLGAALGDPLPGDRRRPPAPRGVHHPPSRGRLRGEPRASGRPAGHRRRAGQRAPRRPAGAPRRRRCRRPPRALRHARSGTRRRCRRSRESVHDRPRTALDARPRGTTRRGGRRAPARPAGRDLPRARAVAGPARSRPWSAAWSSSSTTARPPTSSTHRIGAARSAPTTAIGSTPTRSSRSAART